MLQEDILTNRRSSRLTVDTCTERIKQKMKNEAPYVLLLLKLIKNKHDALDGFVSVPI